MNTQHNEQETSTTHKLLLICCTIMAFCMGSCTLIGGGVILAFGSAAQEVRAQEEAASLQAAMTGVSNITWADVSQYYGIRSKLSDLQKNALWDEEFKNKKVQWVGEITDVTDSYGSLTMQLKMSRSTWTSDVIVTLRPEQRKNATMMLQGDTVTFTGILDRWGTLIPISINYGVIKKIER